MPGVQITFEARNTRNTLAEAFRRVYRGRLLLLRVIGVAFAVGGLLAVALGHAALGIPYVVGGIGFAALAPAVAVHQGVRASWRLAGLPTTFTVGDDGVGTRSSLADGSIAWSDVVRVHRLPAQVVLQMRRHRFLAVPLGDQPEETRSAVLDVVGRHGPAAAPGATGARGGRGESAA
jgi:hypothetical protein